MKISELLSRYGDEDVAFQTLDSCILYSNYDAHHNTTHVTFSMYGMPGADGKKCLMLWLDRDKVNAILAEERAANNG